jgi:hypothetical protein
MYRVKRFNVFENEKIFGVGDIDYIESFTELFTIIRDMKKYNLVDEHGILKVDVDDVGMKLPEFDDLFDTEDEYYKALDLVKEIINNYYKKL